MIIRNRKNKYLAAGSSLLLSSSLVGSLAPVNSGSAFSLKTINPVYLFGAFAKYLTGLVNKWQVNSFADEIKDYFCDSFGGRVINQIDQEYRSYVLDLNGTSLEVKSNYKEKKLSCSVEFFGKSYVCSVGDMDELKKINEEFSKYKLFCKNLKNKVDVVREKFKNLNSGYFRYKKTSLEGHTLCFKKVGLDGKSYFTKFLFNFKDLTVKFYENESDEKVTKSYCQPENKREICDLIDKAGKDMISCAKKEVSFAINDKLKTVISKLEEKNTEIKDEEAKWKIERNEESCSVKRKIGNHEFCLNIKPRVTPSFTLLPDAVCCDFFVDGKPFSWSYDYNFHRRSAKMTYSGIPSLLDKVPEILKNYDENMEYFNKLLEAKKFTKSSSEENNNIVFTPTDNFKIRVRSRDIDEDFFISKIVYDSYNSTAYLFSDSYYSGEINFEMYDLRNEEERKKFFGLFINEEKSQVDYNLRQHD